MSKGEDGGVVLPFFNCLLAPPTPFNYSLMIFPPSPPEIDLALHLGAPNKLKGDGPLPVGTDKKKTRKQRMKKKLKGKSDV